MQYIFHGRVLPERADFNLYPPVTLSSGEHDVVFGCLKSKITIEMNSKSSDNVETLKNVVESAARLFVDSLGYTLVCGYDVEIESVYVVEKQEIVVFGVQAEIFSNEADRQRIRSGSAPEILSMGAIEIAKISAEDVSLRIAMADFREAIRAPDFTAFHCMRALESLRHSKLIGSESGQKLQHLRKTLGISQKTLDKISRPGNEQRHGKILPQDGETRFLQLSITWEVIRRYLMLYKDPECAHEPL